MEINNALVCLLGIGTVFFGLVCIVILCKIMSTIIQATEAKSATQTSQPSAQAVQTASASSEIQNRQEVLAAVSAAIAEMRGTDLSAIRVVSFKKL